VEYFIENGVRRSVAAREHKLSTILANLHEPGKPPALILVRIEDLHSPKDSISQSDPRYINVLHGMSSPQARTKMLAIDVQPLGQSGQQSSVPLTQVKLDP